MLKRVMLTFAVIALSIPAFASRGGNVRIEVKDFKDAASRARVAERVSSSLKDLGSERLSTEFGRVINEQSSRLDVKSQTELAKSMEACIAGLRTFSQNRSSSFQMSKIETVVQTTLSAALAIKSNAFQNPKTQEIAELLFSFSGVRLKEKLENENIEYDLNKIQRVAEIILTSDLSKRSINETEVESLYRALTAELNARTLKEVTECKG